MSVHECTSISIKILFLLSYLGDCNFDISIFYGNQDKLGLHALLSTPCLDSQMSDTSRNTKMSI